MSARRHRLTIKPDARADIDWILLYTRKRWGIDQRRRYRAQLTQALKILREHPELGPERNDLFPGCRNRLVDEHIVYYSVSDDEIVIIRVLHGAQNASGKVTP